MKTNQDTNQATQEASPQRASSTEREEREQAHDGRELCDLVDLFVDMARRQEEIVSKITVAVERQDKDEVFNLAKELVSL